MPHREGAVFNSPTGDERYFRRDESGIPLKFFRGRLIEDLKKISIFNMGIGEADG
jgi:hypothetical protein